MKTYTTKPFVEDFVFLEGPRWHDGRLWVSDIWAHTVYAISTDGTREAIVEVPQRPSGLGFMPDGTPLIVSMIDRRLYKLIDGALVLHADLSDLVTAEINDMLVDAQGRAYVGNMGYDLFSGAPAKTAEITLVDVDGTCRHVARDLDFPNGMVITDAGNTLVVAESFAHRVSVYDIQSDGSLDNRRVLTELPDLIPDGICLDLDGNVWVSGAMGGAFVQIDPRGKVIARIDVAPRAAIACQLGGDDGHTLYCLIYNGGIEELSRGEPGAVIETVRVDAAAAGSP